MNTDDLKTFIRAAELLNFSKTAEELSYSQSTVTIQIKKLENEFGVQLFNRIGKNVSLTPAGRQFLEHAHSIINSVKKAKSDMGNPSSKDRLVRIGSIHSLCNHHLSQVINKVGKEKLNININIVTDSPSSLFDKLDKNQIDLIYIFDESTYSEKWVKVFDRKEKLNFITSNNELKGRKLRINELLNYPFYLTEKNDNYRRALDKLLAHKNIEISPVLEVSNTDVIVKVLKDNDGISFLPSFVAKSCMSEKCGIESLDVQGINLELSRQLFYHKDKFITSEMQKIIDLISEI